MKSIPYIVAILAAGGAAFFSISFSGKFKKVQQTRLETIANHKQTSSDAEGLEKKLSDLKAALAAIAVKKEETLQELDSLKATGATFERDTSGLVATLKAQDEDFADDEDMNPPPANQVGQFGALNATIGMASILFRIEERSEGRFKVCRTAAEIRDAVAQGKIAAIFHIEGAEAIDPELKSLDVLHKAGLRSLGLVWSRDNAFGHGVPFKFPSSPDTGPGLPQRAREHLFQAFQGGVSKGGAGLGLVIAAELVRGHGGRLELGRTNETGTEFVICLPKAELASGK